MRTPVRIVVVVLVCSTYVMAAENQLMRDRRLRAARAFQDGILLVHASSALDLAKDGFRQDPFFYYFTGLENTVGAVLAIEGESGESWLFLPSNPPFLKSGLQPEVQPGPDATKRLGIDHVLDWSALEGFLAQRVGSAPRLYYAQNLSEFDELPPNLLSQKMPKAPLWIQILLQMWPALIAEESSKKMRLSADRSSPSRSVT